MPKVSRLVQRIHFEDFGGAEFERLVFAYHVRAGWTEIAWYGQAGSDHGRDIFGSQLLDDGTRCRAVIQCVNRSSLTQISLSMTCRGCFPLPRRLMHSNS